MSQNLDVNVAAAALTKAAHAAAEWGHGRIKNHDPLEDDVFGPLTGAAALAASALAFFAVTNAYTVMMNLNKPKEP